MTDYKIILADDHAMLREGIKKIIDDAAGLEVIGEASDGLMLLNLLKKAVPDMVILDVAMPKLRGIEAAQEIRKQFPEVAILVLSMHKSREYLQKALAAGARGYVVKEDSGNELIHAIQTIRSGGSYLSPMMMKELSDDPLGILSNRDRLSEDPLTTREREILQLIADGKTSKEIADVLNVSETTVNFHRKNLRVKFGLRNTRTNLRSYLMSISQ